ncbi:unnamed protein product [Choristocarpus tenellus]
MQMYDSNFDGVLEFDEFSKGITMCQLDHLFPRSLQRTLFDKIDRDKSGTVELHEFANFLQRSLTGGAPSRNAWKGHTEKLAEMSVILQPIQDYRSQRTKNKLIYCLNKTVPNASTGLADNRSMFLQKQFALLSSDGKGKSIDLDGLVAAMGPKGMNLKVNIEDLKLLLKEMDTSGDGKVSLREFSKFINLDNDAPVYDPMFDARRRNVNKLETVNMCPPPTETIEESVMRSRLEELHLTTVPSKR